MIIKKYFKTLMYDRQNSLFDRCVKFVLYVASLLYGACVRSWDIWCSLPIVKKHCTSLKVISVGNITVGGTGKTPVTIALARKYAEMGHGVAIAIRGYGDDEWRLLEQSVSSAKIYVGRDRVSSARKAAAIDGCNVLILDDGYQQRCIKKDLNILLIDTSDPFGNGHLIPRGILREPKSSIQYADVIFLTKADMGKENVSFLKSMLKTDYAKERVFEVNYSVRSFYELYSGKKHETDIVRGKKVCVFSGIANPAYLLYMLKGAGARIVEDIEFDDHVGYRGSDVEHVIEKAVKSGSDMIVTTEKDAVKLKGFQQVRKDIEMLVIEIGIDFCQEMEGVIA